MREKTQPRERIPKYATYKEKLKGKLRTKKGQETYKNRSTSVEPIIRQV